MKQISGHPHLRKGSNGVIINTSEQERRSYRQAKQQAKRQLESQHEITELKAEVAELTSLVKQLIQNNGS